MENNFIHNFIISIAASAGQTVCISPIASRILSFKRLWLVGVTIIGGTLQIIVQWCKIAAPSWPNDISSAADNVSFKNRAQNIECSFGCAARSAVLLKTNIGNILPLNFCEQKFIQHGPITIAIDCNGLSLRKCCSFTYSIR